jgi:hypothetical protein
MAPSGAAELTIVRREGNGRVVTFTFPVLHLLALPADSETTARELLVNIARGRPPFQFAEIQSSKA